jgi:hypothetical protein
VSSGVGPVTSSHRFIAETKTRPGAIAPQRWMVFIVSTTVTASGSAPASASARRKTSVPPT